MRDELTMEIGQFYASDAVVDGRRDGEPACMHPDETRGRPGSRVPHAFLPDGRSTLDLATGGPTLLTAPQGHGWSEAADALGFPCVILPGDAARHCGIGKTGALLARPDGFVAWRAVDEAGASGEALADVLKNTLHR